MSLYNSKASGLGEICDETRNAVYLHAAQKTAHTFSACCSGTTNVSFVLLTPAEHASL